MGTGSDFERELLEAMMRPIGEDSLAASGILPYIVNAGPARDFAAELLWDDFVNGG